MSCRLSAVSQQWQCCFLESAGTDSGGSPSPSAASSWHCMAFLCAPLFFSLLFGWKINHVIQESHSPLGGIYSSAMSTLEESHSDWSPNSSTVLPSNSCEEWSTANLSCCWCCGVQDFYKHNTTVWTLIKSLHMRVDLRKATAVISVE